MTVVGISFLTYCFAGRNIVFFTAVLPFDNPGRTLAGYVFAVAALSGADLRRWAGNQRFNAFAAFAVSRVIWTSSVNFL